FPPYPSGWWTGPFPGQPKTLTTGTDGRFKLPGVGADRLVHFQIEGPGIQYGPLKVLTRDLKVRVEPKEKERVNKPIIEPVDVARPIRGMVRDKKTGKPVAGVEVSGTCTTHRAHTDKEGRYELLGYAKNSRGYSVTFNPAEGQPYFRVSFGLPDTPGITPI